MSRRSSLQASQTTPSSTTLTTRVISQGIVLLENLDKQRYAKQARYSTVLADEPDDEDSNSPIYDSFLASQGAEWIVTMTNFSPSQFNLIWTESAVSARDLHLILFTSLTHCGTWDVVTAIFNQKTTTFEKRVMSFLIVPHPYLMRTFVTAVEKKWPMQALRESGQQFKNFPAARYNTDVTFQQMNVEVSVVPNGFAIDCTKFYKGSVSDKIIFDEKIDSHLDSLAKRTGETTLDDSEPGMEQLAVLADKGYQGIYHNFRAVLPLKKPVGGILTFAEQAKNDRITSDRIIVKNYFGRLKTLWAT
ncbi:hypothetical protein DYB37_012428 [Aphanomyces astaci]|uniref:DDE Tnp4 domain-containing protein n=1 Tax=Aphanomyces astaci TaxID=112090 RepID=A0A3R7CNV0_APHAT|nr:hypothetical protein DYB37_012428 [Aphanomyces astaci]